MAKRTDYGTLKQGFGLARGLSEEFLQVCEAKHVPIRAIHRLVTPKGHATMEALAERILADWQVEQPKPIVRPELTTDPRTAKSDQGAKKAESVPLTAQVVYEQPPFEDLQLRFPDSIYPEYNGKQFDPIDICKNVSKRSREIVFEYVHMEHDSTFQEVLDEMERKGLRPALYEELIHFAGKYPDEQRKFSIAAIGSDTDVHGYRRVAYIWGDGGRRGLLMGWSGTGLWSGSYRFLAVCNELPAKGCLKPSEEESQTAEAQPSVQSE